jgi:hypothetical protein
MKKYTSDERFVTKRLWIGHFEVYWNGQKVNMTIVNGSLGMSGHDTPNMYGVSWGANLDKHKWIGPLNSAKAFAYTLCLKNFDKK